VNAEILQAGPFQGPGRGADHRDLPSRRHHGAGPGPGLRSTSAAQPGAIRPGRCTSRWCARPRRRLAPPDPILRWG
jgi:hypothetical protein